jgi:hypothetical protein
VRDRGQSPNIGESSDRRQSVASRVAAMVRAIGDVVNREGCMLRRPVMSRPMLTGFGGTVAAADFDP